MRRLPIRMKLAGALVVPLVALVVVTILEVLATYADVDEVHDQAELATSSIGPPSLLSKLEDERNAAAVHLIGLGDAFALPVEDNAEAWAATDRALDDFRSDVERRTDLTDTFAPALESLDELEDIRASVEGFEGPLGLDNIAEASAVFDRYSSIMDELFASSRLAMLTIQDVDLRRGAELADLSARQTDLLARITRDLMITQLSPPGDGVNEQAEIIVISRELGLLRTNEALIRTKARDQYRPLADDLFADPDVQQFPTLVSGAIQNGTFDLIEVAGTSAGRDAESFGYTVFRRQVIEQLQAEADDLRAEADARLRRYVALATLAALAALLATWLVSRSITRPLRSLTRQAKEMADNHLPAVVLDILQTPLGDDVRAPDTRPVEVRTRDEVADVATALNTVQDTAVDLAAEQAVLRRNIADSFVNLGRRNQNLLGRQLDFITELEAHETDPDTLASLFRLDHLATRMRRNAESLLVLAGIDPPRKWAAPVRMTDAIRSALGEVEDYQRVTMRDVEPTTIMGSAAADVAHLVAEFVENALTFSAPDRSVEIRGATVPGGGYSLAVIDAGFGMPESDIVQANRRLSGTESFTIAPSKYLGHYVAGNLAARHGIRLRLENAPGGGITATIDLPQSLITADVAPDQASALATARSVAPARVPALAGVGGGAPQAAPAGPAGPVGPVGPTTPQAATSFLTPGAPALTPGAEDDTSAGPGVPRSPGGPAMPTAFAPGDTGDGAGPGSGPAMPMAFAPGSTGDGTGPATPTAFPPGSTGDGGPATPAFPPGDAGDGTGRPVPTAFAPDRGPGPGRAAPPLGTPIHPGRPAAAPTGDPAPAPGVPPAPGGGPGTGTGGAATPTAFAGWEPPPAGPGGPPADDPHRGVTASGLAKRSKAPAPEPPPISDDLLASLQRHTENLQLGVLPGGRATPGLPGRDRPGWAPAEQGPSGDRPTGHAEPAGHRTLAGDPTPRTPPTNADPHAESADGRTPAGDPTPWTSPAATGTAGPHGPTGLAGPTGTHGLADPTPTGPHGLAGTHGLADATPAGPVGPPLPTRAPAGPRAAPGATAHGASAAPGPTAPHGTAPGPGPGSAAQNPYGPGYTPPVMDTTPSGLARRVRGAQLPTANPRAIRRAHEDHAPPTGDQRSADEVYGFLSSFTAGVRRGLDDATRATGPGPEAGPGGPDRWDTP